MFGAEVIAAIKDHAVRTYPEEAVGVVLDEGYLPLPNIAVDPEGKAPPEEWRRRHFVAGGPYKELLIGGKIRAIVHSHPGGPDWPSMHDQAQQTVTDVPWGLVVCNEDVAIEPYFWGDMLEPPKLEGRQYRVGPSGTDGRGDCGALVRDWYRLERGILLPDCPRDDVWYKRGGNLYLDHYAKAGFEPVPEAMAQPGDVVLMQIRSPVPNHAALLMPEGLIFHHLEGRLSRTEPLGPWRKFIVNWMRHAV